MIVRLLGCGGCGCGHPATVFASRLVCGRVGEVFVFVFRAGYSGLT